MAPTKPVLHPLKTPKTTVFPSELFSDSSSSVPESGKHEDGIPTPITPPAAYTEFLKALTPIFASPASASAGADGRGASFSRFCRKKPTSASTSQPASAVSGSFTLNESINSATTASLPPPTPASATTSAAKEAFPLRRLRIPQSARISSATDSPQSATTVRSPFSPSEWKDWKLRHLDGARHSHSTTRPVSVRPVSVRQVVTRTVTFKRTKLDDPPKGKRRKANDESSKSSKSPKPPKET